MSGNRKFWTALLGLGLLVGLPAVSLADVVHLHNGQTLRGKLYRSTGEIIQFKPEGYGKTKRIQRLTLTNRHDVVETRDGEKHFGEIIYVDKFKLEIRTATGLESINRFLITNVVLGTPHQKPMSDFMDGVVQAAPSAQQGHIPVNFTPSDIQARERVDLEDTDAIPSDFRAP